MTKNKLCFFIRHQTLSFSILIFACLSVDVLFFNFKFLCYVFSHPSTRHLTFLCSCRLSHGYTAKFSSFFFAAEKKGVVSISISTFTQYILVTQDAWGEK